MKKTKKQKLEEKRKLKQKQKKKQNQDKVENLEENEEEVNHGEVDEIDGGEEGEDENRIEEEEEEKEGEVKEVKEVKRKQLNHEKFLENEKKKAQEMENLPEIDMSEWNQYNIHHKILKGLQYMKFQNPTPIQKECLSIAINEKKFDFILLINFFFLKKKNKITILGTLLVLLKLNQEKLLLLEFQF